MTTATAPRRFVPDERLKSAPKLSTDRPPTRREVWAYCEHVYGGIKDEKALQAFAKSLWIGNYVYAVVRYGWDKPPDWTEGDPAPRAACPVPPHFEAGRNPANEREVYRLLEAFKRAKAAS